MRFSVKQPQVMDTVQDLRQRAYAAGNLRSNDQYRVEPQGRTHRYRAGESAGRLRAVLQPDCGLWAVVVAGVSAGLLGAVARLSRASGIRRRVCVGRRHYVGRGIFLRRLRLASAPRQCRKRQQLLLSAQRECCEPRVECLATRSGSPPRHSLSGGVGARKIQPRQRIARGATRFPRTRADRVGAAWREWQSPGCARWPRQSTRRTRQPAIRSGWARRPYECGQYAQSRECTRR